MRSAIVMGIYEYWLWIGIPVMAGAAAVLWRQMAGLMALTRQAPLFKVPLLPRQDVGFLEAGRVSLALEGARFTTRFAGLGFDLWGRDGLRVSSRPSFLRPRTMDLATITMVMVTFDIPRPGQYTLTISGLDQPSLWDPAYAVVFLRLHIGRMVTSILWIVLLTGIIITSLVFVILRLTGVGLDG